MSIKLKSQYFSHCTQIIVVCEKHTWVSWRGNKWILLMLISLVFLVTSTQFELIFEEKITTSPVKCIKDNEIILVRVFYFYRFILRFIDFLIFQICIIYCIISFHLSFHIEFCSTSYIPNW